MGFEKSSGEGKSAERHEPTKEEIARGIAYVAFQVNVKVSNITTKLEAGKLTEDDLEALGNELERYIFKEICDVAGFDQATRNRGLELEE